MYSLPPHLWEPQRRGVEQTVDYLNQGYDVCLYSPTGGGKTEQAIQLFKWMDDAGGRSAFYVNRKLLVGQTADRFDAAGLRYGIRAADYEDRFDELAPVQICSADTERSRVYNRQSWIRHDANLVVVDEAHIQKGETMRTILDDHKAYGAKVVLLTATPVGLSTWADRLVISGKLKEYRDCKALVPAVVKSIEQPDMRKVTRNATGEYMLDGKKRKIFTQTIVGNVLDRWKRYNPDARPTMLYAPGKPESVFFTEQFHKLGVSWCHVDATDTVVDGKRYKLTVSLWQEILERYKKNDIKGLSSRFKLREGIDVPGTFHAILATPIGSLASYIQTVGRVLRWSPETPDGVLVTDHGGNYWRHGSPNHDRPWELFWNMPEHAVSSYQEQSVKDGKSSEPIRCPRCEMERAGGTKCPGCGFEHQKSSRHVIQENGRMVTIDGNLVKPPVTRMKSDTQKKWEQLYWKVTKHKRNRTFRQMRAWFFHEYHYYPPNDLPYMPKATSDWYRKPWQVDPSALHQPENRNGNTEVHKATCQPPANAGTFPQNAG